MNTSTRRLLIALLGIAGLSAGQTSSVYLKPGAKFGRACPPSGKVIVSELDLLAEPSELDKLVLGADLIVQGRVVKVLPSFNPDPDNAANIWTDSVISVEQSFHGALPANNVAVEQPGGKTQSCEEIVSQDPLMKVGEQYILFLIREKRTSIPNPFGLQLYAPMGVWAGKARIIDQKVAFLPAAHKNLHSYDGNDVAAFIEVIRKDMSAMIPDAQ